MTRHYVLELVEGCSLSEHAAHTAKDQVKLAKKLAQGNGRAAVESGSVNYFWADVDKDGALTVGAFDEDLLED